MYGGEINDNFALYFFEVGQPPYNIGKLPIRPGDTVLQVAGDATLVMAY